MKRMDRNRLPRIFYEEEIVERRFREHAREGWIEVRESLMKRGEELSGVVEDRKWEGRGWWRGFFAKQTH